VHFGLGSAASVDLEVRWPIGKVQKLEGVPANRFIVVDEDQGIVNPVTGATPGEEGT
jgi:hypothetical protein